MGMVNFISQLRGSQMNQYDQYQTDRELIRKQAEAEFEFARSLESQGIDCKQFMDQFGLSLHQFNVLAHCVYEVNDEDPILPLAVKDLLYAFRKTHEPKTRLAAAT